ncbi:alpha/beta hydrolase [Nibrella viscosa]|uniref:Alpha/beta hydrolase n=1 Tax=Nibrella viscosa TaxID=1084524 RepID=A0ABP8L3N1_9BACT
MNIVLKRTLQIIGGLLLVAVLLLAIGAGYIWLNSPGETAPIVGEDDKPLPNSIATMETVDLNGAKQWLIIRGADRTKPVLLFLHGGPGLPELPLLTGSELEQHFVVVNWEQRGSGKSYDPTVFDKTFTTATFVEDAADLSRMLAKRFGTEKIYLMGHSWGTFLGVLTVKKYPELFHAYFSISQVTNQFAGEQISYDWVLQQAMDRGATRQVKKLRRWGRPPYADGKAWLDYLHWQRELVAAYGGGMHKAHFFPLFIQSILLCNEYTLADKINYARGAMKSVRYLWPEVVNTDLNEVAPTLDIPYYLFQGVHDYQTPYALAKQYFDRLQAPDKRLFTFTESAHSPIFEEPEKFFQIISELVNE